MNKFLTIITTLLLLNFYSASAQENKAEKLLNKVATELESYTSMKIHFTYSMVNETEGINENFKGSLLSSKEKFNLSVAGQNIISDGVTIWTYMPDAEEVQISSMDENAQSLNPTAILKQYDEDYDAKIINSNNNLTTIQLLPKKEMKFKSAEIVVNTKTNLFTSITVFDEIGNKYIYKVEELIPNIALNGKEFTFAQEDYPDVDFVDMR